MVINSTGPKVLGALIIIEDNGQLIGVKLVNPTEMSIRYEFIPEPTWADHSVYNYFPKDLPVASIDVTGHVMEVILIEKDPDQPIAKLPATELLLPYDSNL